MTIDASKTYTATVATTAGTFVITWTPRTQPNLRQQLRLPCQKGFYHCVIFHRVIPGFVDQTGDHRHRHRWPGLHHHRTSCRRPPARSTPRVGSPWPTPARPTRAGASGSSWLGAAVRRSRPPTRCRAGDRSMDVVNTDHSEGNSATAGYRQVTSESSRHHQRVLGSNHNPLAPCGAAKGASPWPPKTARLPTLDPQRRKFDAEPPMCIGPPCQALHRPEARVG